MKNYSTGKFFSVIFVVVVVVVLYGESTVQLMLGTANWPRGNYNYNPFQDHIYKSTRQTHST
jgi:hypothetical protein